MTELNYNEILMYLGHRGQDVSPEVETQIRKCCRLVKMNVHPRLVYRRLPVSEGAVAGFPMEGEDIRKLLVSSHEAVLMAVTLGPRIEQILMRCEVTNMADAVILDACASVAVENVCDHFEQDLREELAAEGLYLTSRFSPGYGDLPLNTQIRMCGALNAEKRIGLTVTDNFILIPRKSVTAVMGISRLPQKLRKRGCEACSMFLKCPYRKTGTTCRG